MNGVRFAVLDLDDTLLATECAKRRGRRALAQLGIDARKFAAADHRWWDRFEEGSCSIEEVWHGRLVDCGVERTRTEEISQLYRSISNVLHLRRGATRLVGQLNRSGFRTVILTNGPRHPQREQALGALRRKIDGIVWAGDSPVRKPSPEAFVQALALIDGQPREAISIGDRFHLDIQPALELGFVQGIWLTRQPSHPDPRVACVRSLEYAASMLGPTLSARNVA
ncbi:MAG: HAD family hydrolase [Chloroflexota bacterium]|nr:HAD family hydrolase [Chloroflexota bacterium]